MPENRIKICTLWSLEKVKPNYTFDLDDRRIYNEKTGLPLREMKDSGGYRKVELQTVGKKTKPLYVRIHKIVALAMIHNGPYELIEHLDDDKENNDPGNLAFSTHRENAISMLRNGKGNFPLFFFLPTKTQIYIPIKWLLIAGITLKSMTKSKMLFLYLTSKELLVQEYG